jgi:hypothetical protein
MWGKCRGKLSGWWGSWCVLLIDAQWFGFCQPPIWQAMHWQLCFKAAARISRMLIGGLLLAGCW